MFWVASVFVAVFADKIFWTRIASDLSICDKCECRNLVFPQFARKQETVQLAVKSMFRFRKRNTKCREFDNFPTPLLSASINSFFVVVSHRLILIFVFFFFFFFFAINVCNIYRNNLNKLWISAKGREV